jgi:DNA mismatch repair ATPase MutS
MQQIKSLPADKFAFYVVDEPLKGSNAEDCAKIGRGVIEDLGSNGNALLVVATHHPAFTEIAKVNDSFRNYRVHSILYSAEVENPATGVVKTEYAWKHTYKVVPGIEKNRFALVMMEEELAKSDLDFSASKDMLAGAR